MGNPRSGQTRAPDAARAVVDDDLERELAAVAEGAGCELAHAEFKGGVLRLFIDRAEGVTLADCENVSRQVSALLDVLDFGPGRYLLEVSSPGLDRQLYRARDYERFVGRKVRVTWFAGGDKRTVVGRLEAFDPAGGGTATVAEEGQGAAAASHDIPLADIAVARLEIEI
jgi:ribosome maturation factor RimP